MKNYKLPKIIIIAGRKVAVKPFLEGVAKVKNLYGEFDFNIPAIFIDFDYPDPQHILTTLIHEINHAIYDFYNIYDDSKEEETVTAMAYGWTQVYKDNPKLIEFIREVSK